MACAYFMERRDNGNKINKRNISGEEDNRKKGRGRWV